MLESAAVQRGCRTSHSRAAPSSQALAYARDSAAAVATSLTTPPCPRALRTRAPVSASHTHTDWSADAEKTCAPSLPQATLSTALACCIAW